MIFCCDLSYAQKKITGVIRDDKGSISGATIKVTNSIESTSTDSIGRFNLLVNSEAISFTISHLGYDTREININENLDNEINIILRRSPIELDIITVNTGYQEIPKERSTGSIVYIDSQLIDRRVSTDIIDRLEDVTSGVIFNKGVSAGGNPISIRGRNTIYGDADPLIVIDNFPFEGDIGSINPNDVESITILKDAAAASIWGSRAGNGVIVITTKRGKSNKRPQISFISNATVSEKPNIFYQNRMSSIDFIEVEKTLFSKGYYQNAELSYRNEAITPVGEILIAQREGVLTEKEAGLQMEKLKVLDLRDDIKKYLYRNSFNQQYSLNINGGEEAHRYYLSAGFDKNEQSLVGNQYSRFTLNANNDFVFAKGKLDVSTNIYYSQSKSVNNNPAMAFSSTLFPYARLADDFGNPLSITHNYRQSFIETSEQNGLLNWEYSPLKEIEVADNKDFSIDCRIDLGLRYKIFSGLNSEVLYRYNRSTSHLRNLRDERTYFTRDLINNFTQINSDGSLIHPIPLGGIVDLTNTSNNGHSIRGQLAYGNKWGSVHEINAIAGYELRDYETIKINNRMYGYNELNAIPTKVDYASIYPQYYNKGYSTTIPFNDYVNDLTDRYISYYSNAAYTYSQRYTLSASGRLDKSNLFGVNSNQKGTPLYSIGFGWTVSNEKIYPLKSYLPYLKLRATYGYNGNVNKSLSAYTTAIYLSGGLTNQTYAAILNPPNPDLRWEKVRMINMGLDFSNSNKRVNGSIEYYLKKGTDLIGDISFAPSTGITKFRGNTTSTKGYGVDLQLNVVNLDSRVKWSTNLLLSTTIDKVVDYHLEQPAIYYAQYGANEIYPLNEKPLYAVYSYKWAGLDNQTGDPLGFTGDVISKDYNSIINTTLPHELILNGPVRPTLFGSIRNNFGWKQFSFSANISYRFGHYFRAYGISYNDILTGKGYYEGNYVKRWINPGDEKTTSIPSLPSAINYNRDRFFNYSEAMVEKGDNIRFQDFKIGYNLIKSNRKSIVFNRVQVYLYANNLGLIWKSTSSKLDPDYPDSNFTPVTTYSFGINIEL